MPRKLELIVASKRQSERISLDGEPIALGRNPSSSFGERALKLLDSFVSRSQLLISPGKAGVKLQNLSQQIPIEVDLPERLFISPGDSRDLAPPIRLRIGETLIEIVAIEVGNQRDHSMQTIETPVSPVLRQGTLLESNPDTEMLIRWFETLVTLQRAAAGSDQFYFQTARATVDLVGLDQGMVLLRNGGRWTVVAEHSRNSTSVTYSRAVLEQVVREKRTFYQLAQSNLRAESLQEVNAVVASPVFNAAGDDAIGAVYGVRTSGGNGSAASDLGMLHAQLVQVLAAVVSSGLARQESEAVAARRHVQFEQFVSPEIVRELDRNPQLLDGSEREITAMFVDIRDFSHLSERLSAEQVCGLVGSIMDRLSNQVREYQGTTVSYLGDGLLAMWNAPVDQPSHAELACRAAIGMLNELPLINEQWSAKVDMELRIGIGINTGRAMVGNTGSHHKPHYGPLGHHVNLASRVEGVTKQMGVPILITEDTRRGLDSALPTRRLCQVRVAGIGEAVALFELYPQAPTSEWKQRRDVYESALGLYEAGQWSEACNQLISLLDRSDGQHDSPTVSLLARTVECLQATTRREDFDPAWNLKQK